MVRASWGLGSVDEGASAVCLFAYVTKEGTHTAIYSLI